MTNAQDEVSSTPETERRVSAFALALERSQLARDLKRVFQDIGNTGTSDDRYPMHAWDQTEFEKRGRREMEYEICIGLYPIVGDGATLPTWLDSFYMGASLSL